MAHVPPQAFPFLKAQSGQGRGRVFPGLPPGVHPWSAPFSCLPSTVLKGRLPLGTPAAGHTQLLPQGRQGLAGSAGRPLPQPPPPRRAPPPPSSSPPPPPPPPGEPHSWHSRDRYVSLPLRHLWVREACRSGQRPPGAPHPLLCQGSSRAPSSGSCPRTESLPRLAVRPVFPPALSHTAPSLPLPSSPCSVKTSPGASPAAPRKDMGLAEGLEPFPPHWEPETEKGSVVCPQLGPGTGTGSD